MPAVQPSRFRVRPLPRPERPRICRRRQRSNDIATSLERALSGAVVRGGLDVVLLVDDEGLLVGSSRTELDLSMLAAVTPIVGRGRAIPRIRRQGRQRDMSVRPIMLQGELLYLAAIGGSYSARQRELLGGAAAARRILA
jgi:hypothetical protein